MTIEDDKDLILGRMEAAELKILILEKTISAILDALKRAESEIAKPLMEEGNNYERVCTD